jgi:hypothetical protein
MSIGFEFPIGRQMVVKPPSRHELNDTSAAYTIGTEKCELPEA